MIKKTGVAFIRPEVAALLPVYEKVADCVIGETAVKARKQRYLPAPNPGDTSKENVARYEAYLRRAVFYNVTKKTLAGLVGFLFVRKPEVQLPSGLAVMEADADGAGVSLEQLAKQAAEYTLSLGRAGVLVDYPRTDGGATAEQLANGEVRPTLKVYDSAEIINWRTGNVGARKVFTLLVLRETYDVETREFEVSTGTRYRVYRRTPAGVTVEFWTGGQESNGYGYRMTEGPFSMTIASGAALEDIPFFFIGVNSNNETPDDPPLADLADLNIAHYRNSADYEEACYIVGQPTPWVAGVTKDWAKDILNDKIQLGSRAVIPLPEGGSAGLLQVTENTMPFSAMEHKEKQMIALGAKLIEDKQTQRTATEVDAQNVSESSALASTARNVSQAFTQALSVAATLHGDGGAVAFRLHENLGLSTMTAADRLQLMKEWQGGALTWSEYRAALRQVGVATEDDTTAKEQIDAERAASLDLTGAAPNVNNGGAGA